MTSDANTCWLHLVRHGATDNNRADPPRLQGCRSDPGLSEEGRQQAESAGRILADRPIQTVYSSPLLRARQTAEAIAEPLGLTVETVDDLIEVDVGDWEGRDWDEIQRTDPEVYRAFMTDASINCYLGGENLTIVQQRATPAFTQIMAENLGRHIVAVAHNCVNRAYLAQLINLPLSKYRSIPQDNCGINLIRFRNGRSKLVTVNEVWHAGLD